MTKAEIITEIASKTGIEKVDVQEAVEAFFKVVKNSMFNGENVYIRGFGSFVVNNNTSYDGFQLLPNSGTMTGGTISVYGRRK